jgi:hypothetical protein
VKTEKNGFLSFLLRLHSVFLMFKIPSSQLQFVLTAE